MGDWWSWPALILWAIAAVLIVLPPKWDPAIRWKERQEKQRGR